MFTWIQWHGHNDRMTRRHIAALLALAAIIGLGAGIAFAISERARQEESRQYWETRMEDYKAGAPVYE